MLKEQCGAVHNPTSTVLVVTVVHICADRRAWDKLFIGTTPSPVAKRQHLVSVDVKPQQSVTGPRSADLTAVDTLSDLRHPTSASRAHTHTHTHTHTLNNVPLTYAPEMNCSYAAAKILLEFDDSNAGGSTHGYETDERDDSCEKILNDVQRKFVAFVCGT